MFSAEEKERYDRHFILEGFGAAAQEKLKQAKVLVVGAGGLGCPALLYLVAAGVGYIGIVDDDKVSLSNLQRQVLYTTEDIGEPKATAAKKRLTGLNPSIEIQAIEERIDVDNALALIAPYHIVIDATDNFSTRYLLNDATVILKKPLVYGAIHKFEGQVSVFNLEDGPTYRCLFPSMPTDSSFLNCAEVGVIGVLPGLIGTWQAVEAIKIITNIGTPAKGKLLSFDLLQNKMSGFNFPAVPENKNITELGVYAQTCEPAFNEIDKTTLRQWQQQKDIQLIDVREKQEYQLSNLGGTNIPLSELEYRIDEIDVSKTTVVHCQSGVRSKKAISLIKTKLPSIEVYDLKMK